MKQEISIAFLGTLVPDTKEFQNTALTRAGNMVQDGIVSGLHACGAELRVFSHRPIASFPNDRTLFCKKMKLQYKDSIDLIIVPFINILFVKTITGALFDFFALLKWVLQNRNKERVILVYNAYTPPIDFVYWMGKITRSKTVAILYDLGMPPKELNLNLLKKAIYRFVEFFAKIYIPRLDGRIVINENIALDYAPGKHFLLVDGGISSNITDRLFELKEKTDREKTVFLLAGSLWGANGTQLIIETLNLNNNPKIEMWFAGDGVDVDFIKAAAEKDQRIKYKGKLNLDQLFDLYREVDVLMNIRVTSNGEGNYLFPSKILEYLAVGKYTISTKVAHIEKEYGFLCKLLENNNSTELSAAMDELTNLSENEMFERGKHARNYMLNSHTWENQSAKIKEYITRLIKV